MDQSTLKSAKDVVSGLEGKQKAYGEHYVKAIEKVIAKGPSYVENEIARLAKVLGGGSVTADRKTLFLLRTNILKAFLPEEAKAEL